MPQVPGRTARCSCCDPEQHSMSRTKIWNSGLVLGFRFRGYLEASSFRRVTVGAQEPAQVISTLLASLQIKTISSLGFRVEFCGHLIHKKPKSWSVSTLLAQDLETGKRGHSHATSLFLISTCFPKGSASLIFFSSSSCSSHPRRTKLRDLGCLQLGYYNYSYK